MNDAPRDADHQAAEPRAARDAPTPATHYPDETGPFACECCPATHPGDQVAARAIGWGFTWDGWLCPDHFWL